MLSQHRRPLAIGALAAAFMPTVVLICYLAVRSLANGEPRDLLFVASVTAAVSIPFGLVSAFVVGLPFMVILRALGRLNAILVCLGAGAIGACSLVGFEVVMIGVKSSGSVFEWLSPGVLIGSGLGSISGLAACIVCGIRL